MHIITDINEQTHEEHKTDRKTYRHRTDGNTYTAINSGGVNNTLIETARESTHPELQLFFTFQNGTPFSTP